MRLARILAISAPLLVLGACGGGSDDSNGNDNAELRPADEVIAEEERANAEVGAFEVPAEIGGLAVIVESITYLEDVDDDGTGNDYRISVAVRVENRSGDAGSRPGFDVRCSNVAERGTWYIDSTYQPYEELPDDTFAEGSISLGVPAGCEEPAVWAEPVGISAAKDVYWPVPPEATSA